ncbi:MAG TPA: chemotaxis protein CheW [Gemmatimonadales bacterium]|nr:chemotaxis protein CheW [Gemmatimonadales bacterium]
MSTTVARRYLLVAIGGREVGLAIEHVLEVVDLAGTFPVPAQEPAMRGVVEVRGRLLPVFHLAAMLDGRECPAARSDVGILTRVGGAQVCLEVESAEAVVSEAVLAIPPGERLPWAVGVAQRDGTLVPILDIKALGARLQSAGASA